MKRRGFAAFRKLIRALSPFEAALSRIPGVAALYRAIYRRVKPTGLIRVEVPHGRLWVNAADEGVARPILLTGSFEARETELVGRLLSPGMRVIDAGANVGYYSVLAARLVGAGGSVFCFEPEPGNFELLERNLAENRCDNARAFRLALSNAAGTARLHVDRTNLGNPSMVGENVPDPAGAVEVETVTLDAFLAARGERHIDFLKIDVQGAEGQVLEGAGALLDQAGLTILMELWPRGLERAGTEPAALLAGLRARGYALRLVDGSPERALSVDEVLLAAARSRDGFVNLLLRRD